MDTKREMLYCLVTLASAAFVGFMVGMGWMV
jgi:hypothetical protein